jgi:hypothetical protein
MILREPISDAKRLALTVHPPLTLVSILHSRSWLCGNLLIDSYGLSL